MSFADTVNFIFKRSKAIIGGIRLDASVQEIHTSAAEVTENPIEGGKPIADNVILKPKTLQINGIISDAPLSIFQFEEFIAGLGTIFGQSSRSMDAYQSLLKLQEDRIAFAVVTGLRSYENMILENFTVMRSAAVGRALSFSATLKQITFAYSRTLTEENLATDNQDRGSSQVNRGNVPVEEIAVADAPQSAAQMDELIFFRQ